MILSYNELKLNIPNKQVKVNGTEIQFTRKEFEILKLFLEHKNQFFTREDLIKFIWSDEAYVLGRIIDVNIFRIRHKMGDYGKYIVTKVGKGYGFKV